MKILISKETQKLIKDMKEANQKDENKVIILFADSTMCLPKKSIFKKEYVEIIIND